MNFIQIKVPNLLVLSTRDANFILCNAQRLFDDISTSETAWRGGGTPAILAH